MKKKNTNVEFALVLTATFLPCCWQLAAAERIVKILSSSKSNNKWYG